MEEQSTNVVETTPDVNITVVEGVPDDRLTAGQIGIATAVGVAAVVGTVTIVKEGIRLGKKIAGRIKNSQAGKDIAEAASNVKENVVAAVDAVGNAAK